MNQDLNLPALQDCRCLFLRDYEILLNIGVHEFEKKGEQRVVINAAVYIPLAASTPARDMLQEVVDYDFIRTTITNRVSKGHIHLQETLCDDLVMALLNHPHVMGVRLSTMKPDVYSDCGGVGVEIFKLKKVAGLL